MARLNGRLNKKFLLAIGMKKKRDLTELSGYILPKSYVATDSSIHIEDGILIQRVSLTVGAVVVQMKDTKRNIHGQPMGENPQYPSHYNTCARYEAWFSFKKRIGYNN